ncbi:unnamed protein product [Mycena citricolor]|uniref:Uncharacterized protein n=1 Tax=Mycena citricolor TaxID=2018698 RepID=A0AAD2JX62_9AGAR|nr:unnamed protein product [Mycena citricolor]
MMNNRILLALKATPRELLFGRPFTLEQALPDQLSDTTASDADIHFAVADSIRWTAHLRSLERAAQQKSSFEANGKIVRFEIGDLVQWYDSEADNNRLSVNKLKPRWSAPVQIYARQLNSFSLCDLEGRPLKNLQFVHSRRLRHYIPLRDSTLDQKHPRRPETGDPSTQDLEIATAEERMAEEAWRSTL